LELNKKRKAQKFEKKTHFSIGFDHGFAMTRVDFVPAVGAESDPLSKKQKLIKYKSSTIRVG